MVDLVVRNSVVNITHGNDFAMDEAEAVVESILDSGLSISRWSLWIGEVKLSKDVSSTQFKKFVGEYPNHKLIMVGRRRGDGRYFKSPVLRMEAEGSKPASTTTTKLGRVQPKETKLGRKK